MVKRTARTTPNDRLFLMHKGRLTPASEIRSSEWEGLSTTNGVSTLGLDDFSVAQLYAASVTAWVCANRRATLGSAFPLRVIDSEQNPIPGGYPVADFVSRSKYFLWHISTSLFLWGICILRKRRNPSGLPTGVEWLNPLDVSIRFDQMSGQIINFQVVGESAPTQPSEVVFLREWNPIDSTRGLSRFAMVIERLKGESSIATYAANFFLNSARLDGIMSFEGTITEQELEEHQARWQVFKGVRNAFKAFFAGTSGGGRWRWEPVQSNPIDLAMTELKDDIRLDICGIMEINPALVGFAKVADSLSASSTFGAIKAQHIEDVELPFVGKYIGDINTAWLAADFPYYRGGATLEVDQQQVIGAGKSTPERSAVAVGNSTGRIWTVNESRQHVGAGPLDGVIQVNPDWAVGVYQGGVARLNEARRAVGLPIDPALDGYKWQLETPPPAPSPFGGFSLPGQSKPVALLPANTPPVLSKVTKRGGPFAYAILSLENDPMIGTLAEAARAALKDTVGIFWHDPKDYHCTLAYSPLAAPEQIEQLSRALPFDTEAPELVIGGLSSFEGDGPIPLILTVELNEGLAELQRTCAAAFEDCGCMLSEYSKPEQYKPHITLGYLPAGTAIPELALACKVKPKKVRLSQEYYTIIAGGRASAPDSPFLSNAVRRKTGSIRWPSPRALQS